MNNDMNEGQDHSRDIDEDGVTIGLNRLDDLLSDFASLIDGIESDLKPILREMRITITADTITAGTISGPETQRSPLALRIDGLSNQAQGQINRMRQMRERVNL